MIQENIVFHLFKTLKHSYLYDVNTNSIIEINEKLFCDIKEFETNRIITDPISQLRKKGYLLISHVLKRQ